MATHETKESYWMISYVNPLAAIDSFGLGGLLAYFYHYAKGIFERVVSSIYLLPLSIVLFLMVLILSSQASFVHDNIWSVVFERFFAGLFAFFLIAQSLGNSSWLVGRFFTLNWVSYLGQISYGIYLYHNVVYNYYHTEGNTIIGYLTKYFPELSSEMANFILLKFGLSLVVVISLASLSWFFIEKPINRYKNRI
jgi:peptidoglycan/LPS O-acetylase OafA/YrhL